MREKNRRGALSKRKPSAFCASFVCNDVWMERRSIAGSLSLHACDPAWTFPCVSCVSKVEIHEQADAGSRGLPEFISRAVKTFVCARQIWSKFATLS